MRKDGGAAEDIRRRAARELARRELARRNFGDYLAYVNGDGWIRTRFSEYLAGEIQAFVEGETGDAYDILLIEAPPQHGKSITVTEAAPAWFLGRHPNWRVIIASYNDDSAERFARRNKEKVRDFGPALFGVGLGDINRATEFELGVKGIPHPPPAGAPSPRGRLWDGPSSAPCGGTFPQGKAVGGVKGRLISRGILAGITGNPADLMIIDDPVKSRAEADSPTIREKIWGEWLNSMKSRLSAGAKVIVIMTPWHEDDMAARLLASEENIRLIRLPVEAEEGDPLGRTPGEPLGTEIGKGEQWLAQFKASYLKDPQGGARAWAALYQCAPRVEGGSLVKRGWWRFYDPARVAAFGTQVISVDAAFKGGENNDYVAITVWGKLGANYYLRYCLNRHMDFPQTVAAIRTVRKLYPRALAVLIEDKANGPAIVQTLQKEMFCIPVDPKGGKEARVNAVSPAIESGHVFLPEGEPWTADFVDQFTAFPAGKHDDMVDSATQALSYLLWASGEAAAGEEGTAEREEGRFGEELFDGEISYDIYGGIL